jgi:hypothetical protein
VEGPNASAGESKLPFLLVLVMIAVGVSSGLRVQSPSPPKPVETEPSQPPADVQSLPARLWQDPFEVTEKARALLPTSSAADEFGAEMSQLPELVTEHIAQGR